MYIEEKTLFEKNLNFDRELVKESSIHELQLHFPVRKHRIVPKEMKREKKNPKATESLSFQLNKKQHVLVI